MISGYRIPAALLYLLCCLLCVAGEEVIRLQELEGNTVTIHTGRTGVQSDAQIIWFYGPESAEVKIVDSLVIRGEIITDYNRDRFRDRLQLDRTSGSLTIRNISREDSGVYKLQIITGRNSVWSFSVDVYAPVSKPIIKYQPRKRSVSHRETCSPLCTVENGKDVNLSWYEEKERIYSITSTDSSERLYLSLNLTDLNRSTYSCVAANPVSNQTAQLNINNVCYINTDDMDSDKSNSMMTLAAVLISAGLIGAVCVGLWIWEKKTKQHVSEYTEVNYAEVKTQNAKLTRPSEQMSDCASCCRICRDQVFLLTPKTSFTTVEFPACPITLLQKRI
ncbi:hypothetical protein NFI96_004400 [Prochilodus magdalenae]|nr:hypothetical protein NFI96_004400 [Prochilodus magdalenae]